LIRGGLYYSRFYQKQFGDRFTCLDGRFGIGYTVFGVFLPVKKIDMNIADTNARVIIAFSLTMILAVLTYIAFFKKARSSKSPR